MAQWMVGDARVTAIGETTITVPLEVMPSASHEYVDATTWLPRESLGAAHELEGLIQAFVVEIGGARVIVDPCVGNGKHRTYEPLSMLDTDFLERLTAAGFDPDSIDIVTSTHLHMDHTGWNTRWEQDAWVPTFPNARYVYNQAEWDHHQGVQAPDFLSMYEDSLRPVEQAGLIDLIDMATDVVPGLRFIASPGHTAAHVCLQIESGGTSGLITGDSFHHQLQVAEPTWSSAFDEDGAAAAITRAALVEGLVDCDTTLIGTHFKGVTAGKVISTGSGLRLEAV
ncbi:MAG: fold metallo-hydrolase [Acidimicrobiales bacterium]|nr:fold metallo-hydrolase [Acidimicrobiales bacterium]